MNTGNADLAEKCGVVG